ncbi:P27 family phage terminase small subunit [Acidobacteria bacterium AH-259-A15]|nr:P27 family phage terminase small subunit [Acidobacteria bacterium AH-259-A15]
MSATRSEKKKADLKIVPFQRKKKSPAPDRYWLVQTKKQWEEFWSSNFSKDINLALDRAAVTRLFSLYDERERSYRAYRTKRLVTGSRKQPIMNPLSRILAQLDNQIRQLEDRLLMNPKARRQAGLVESVWPLEDLNRALDDDEEEQEDPRK